MKKIISDGVDKVKTFFAGLTPGEQARQEQIDQRTAETLAARTVEEDEVEQVAVPDKTEETFPTDFGKSLDILKQREQAWDNRSRNLTRTESRQLLQALERIRKHVHAMQNLPPAPNAIASQFSHERTVHHSAQEKRAERLARLKALLDVFPGEPEGRNWVGLAPKARLFHYVGLRESFCIVRWLWLDWQIAAVEAFPITNPSERLLELNHQIKQAVNAKEVEDIQQEISLLSTSAAEDIAQVTKKRIGAKRADYEKSLRVFIFQALLSLIELKKEAVLQEILWFDSVEKPYEQTSLSRAYDAAIADLKALTINAETIKYFGIDIG